MPSAGRGRPLEEEQRCRVETCSRHLPIKTLSEAQEEVQIDVVGNDFIGRQ